VAADVAAESALVGAWRAAAVLVVAAVPAVLARWALEFFVESAADVAIAASSAVGLVVAAAGAFLWPRRPCRLAFTDAGWAVTSRAPSAAGPRLAPSTLHGHPVLALDLGAWLLVRFDVAAAPVRGHVGCSARADGVDGFRRRLPRRLWLPLAAARDPAGWPALRAALWTWRPRPAATPERALPR
jgi:hypothetical protein